MNLVSLRGPVYRLYVLTCGSGSCWCDSTNSPWGATAQRQVGGDRYRSRHGPRTRRTRPWCSDMALPSCSIRGLRRWRHSTTASIARPRPASAPLSLSDPRRGPYVQRSEPDAAMTAAAEHRTTGRQQPCRGGPSPSIRGPAQPTGLPDGSWRGRTVPAFDQLGVCAARGWARTLIGSVLPVAVTRSERLVLTLVPDDGTRGRPAACAVPRSERHEVDDPRVGRHRKPRQLVTGVCALETASMSCSVSAEDDSGPVMTSLSTRARGGDVVAREVVPDWSGRW